VTLGFPFGLSVIVPFNLPLPTKIVAQVLQPVELELDSDVSAVDAGIRSRMQTALDRLARQRRLPILG
jgi:hypothetical protein